MLTDEQLEALATIHLAPLMASESDELDLTPLMRAVEKAAVAAERERCAKIADEHASKRYNWGSENADIYHAQANWAAAIAKQIRNG
jgi:hypothetical protein